MRQMTDNKQQAQWEAEAQAGLMNSAQYPELGYAKCVDGFAEAITGDHNNTFRCNNVRRRRSYLLMLILD
jgi:hypothetical protein